MDLPFKEEIINKSVSIRKFSKGVKEEDLQWHWDEEDRIVVPLHETDWMFQFDNFLPQKLDRPIFIPKGIMHRAIKGTGDLNVKIIRINI